MPEPDDFALEERLTLAELVNRVLDRGVVVSGEAVVSVAGIDLLYVGLRVVLSSVESLRDSVRRTAPSAGELPPAGEA